MGLWTLTTATNDLRTLASDGPQDRIRYRTKVFGNQDGVNVTFKTFEQRRVTNFTTPTAPVGIYLNGVLQTCTLDDIITGEFQVPVAPQNSDTLEATYYYQWFFDAELQTFLKNSAQSLIASADPTQIIDGLQPAALHYATAEAYEKMAARWAERASEVYQLQDAPVRGTEGPVKSFLALASAYTAKADKLRDDYYERQGMALSPNFISLSGNVGAITPCR
jgi:hypothetical protein